MDTLELSDRDYNTLQENMDNPRPYNEQLAKAFERYNSECRMEGDHVIPLTIKEPIGDQSQTLAVPESVLRSVMGTRAYSKFLATGQRRKANKAARKARRITRRR